jgi:hypothetical protein
LPGRFISAASIARFAIVIEPEVPSTDPLVRRAKVSVPAGVSAAVIFIVPELVPSTSPILTTSATRRFISAATKESLWLLSEPKLIWRSSVLGAIVTTPEAAETVALRAIVSAFSKMSAEFEVKVPEFDIEVPKI